MVKVGVIGLGMMGGTHLDVYARRSDVQVVAVADLDEGRRTGRAKAAGNIEGQAKGGFDLVNGTHRRYADGRELIADPEIELVDVCLPTPLHMEYAIAALKAGKHLLVEKPVARTYADARKLVAAAKKARGLSMCAMCMRFWPGWTWLKNAVDRGTYGKVLAATFRRVASHPGGPFYSSGDQCGGAILDLHIHDTDYVQYLFGMPKGVTSTGYSRITNAVDHVVTTYHYDSIPLVQAEGGWAMSAGFGFSMRYTVNFERATAIFDLGAKDTLTLCENGKAAPVPIEPAMGYELEIAYFIDCINAGRAPTTVTLDDAANSVKIVEAEVKSVQTGKRVAIKG